MLHSVFAWFRRAWVIFTTPLGDVPHIPYPADEEEWARVKKEDLPT
ncbi:hypothetical protein [Solirubrum puertoriconensis]|nr:hypothetical protein [Solirubrum puertoriconensis]